MLPLHLQNAAFASLAGPFVEAGVLEAEEAVIVDRLAPLGPESDPLRLLGLAFAVRAPRLGSVGVDLTRLRDRAEADLNQARRDGDEVPPLAWPEGEAWRARIFESALVGDGNAAEPRPFVRSGALLLTWRHWIGQEALARGLVARVAAQPTIAGAALDEALLAEGLARLFPEGSGAGDQLAAAEAGVRGALTVVTGGPGTGKTFAVKNVLALLGEQWRARHGQFPLVALAAPTGKAAWRMTEATREGLDRLPVTEEVRAWLAGLEAVTLHRLLGARLGGRGFRHGAAWPLPVDVVVVDEASMVDLALMTRLVEAVPASARLILAGDPDQLASVGAGTVLADVATGFAPSGLASGGRGPLVRLHRARRFAAGSGVARLAEVLSAGLDDDAERVTDWLTGRVVPDGGALRDVELHPLEGGRLPAAVLTLVVDACALRLQRLVAEVPAPGERQAFLEARLADLEAFRVLTAHRAGPLGVSGLTRSIIAALRERLPGVRFEGGGWLGRPVLVTENRYDLGLHNGDVGLVAVGSAGDRRVIFPGLGACGALDDRVMGRPWQAPLRRGEPVTDTTDRLPGLLPGGGPPDPQTEPGSARRSGLLDGATLRELDVGRLPAHETAFVHTVHRAQGSQYDTVVVVLPDRPSPLLTRELVYTAITRARRRLVLAADPEILRQALGQRVERTSTLAESIVSWRNGHALPGDLP
jgi:exodeoxyribonuclease V alpha subunit